MIQVQLKLRPTKAQARTLDRWLFHLTGVWNWSIRTIAANPRLTAYELKARLVGHAQTMEMPSRALTGTAATAHESWRRYFSGTSGRPLLKGRRRPMSSISFDIWKNRPRNGRITVPVLGSVRFHRQDIPVGHVGAARLVRRASGWYLCLFVRAEPPSIPHAGDGVVGIDPGFSSLLTLSTGEKIEHPHEWRRHEPRIGQAQRGHRTKLASRLAERVRNIRRNRNHHLSRKLVADNAFIAFSADQHSRIARRFGKSVASAGHFELRRQIAYKSLTGGRRYIEVPSRNSTRTCSSCGALSGPTGWAGLSVRTWTCGCGATHDRDCNAAINTLRLGLERASSVGASRQTGIAS
jgi:putative transposase